MRSVDSYSSALLFVQQALHNHQTNDLTESRTNSYGHSTSITNTSSHHNSTITTVHNDMDDEVWNDVETRVVDNLERLESMRKYCAYCGLKEKSAEASGLCGNGSLILGRCYGCQITYYCSQEHQQLDWFDVHMSKCPQLEWVSLCEFIESIDIQLSTWQLNVDDWPDNCQVKTWTDWFEIKHDVIEYAQLLAESINNQLVRKKNCLNRLNRRELALNELTDGLLAKITDSMTYSLTIGQALRRSDVNPGNKPICVHVLYPANELFNDLIELFVKCVENFDQVNLNQTDIDAVIRKQFSELVNMFRHNKGIELVFISDETCIETSYYCKQQNAYRKVLVDWSKLIRKKTLSNNNVIESLLHTNAAKTISFYSWHGTYADFIKFTNEFKEFTRPDLVVAFSPDFVGSTPSAHWKDDLRLILKNNLPCLFTFSTNEQVSGATGVLNSLNANIAYVESNEFSSLLLRQTPAKPNSVSLLNGYCLFAKGLKIIENESELLSTALNSRNSYFIRNDYYKGLYLYNKLNMNVFF